MLVRSSDSDGSICIVWYGSEGGTSFYQNYQPDGAVSLTLNFLRFGAVLGPKLGNAHAASLVQAPQVPAGRHPTGRLALLPVHPEFSRR